MATLVYHSGALGDFLTTLPTLGYYRQITKEPEIVLLGKPNFGTVALQSGYIDTFFDINSSRYTFLFNESNSSTIASFFNYFSTALFFTHDQSQILLHANNQINLRVLHQPPFPHEKIHIIDYHLSLLNFTKNEIKRPAYASLATRHTVDTSTINHKFMKPYVILAPGSGSALKNWPIERYRTIAQKLKEYEVQVYWVVGEAEKDLKFNSSDSILKDCDLTTLVSIFKDCALFIGNDSGITHLAAASHCPVIAIFGPSNPDIWSPRGPSISIIYKNVCQPCHLNKDAIDHCNRRCLSVISAHDVLLMVKDKIPQLLL